MGRAQGKHTPRIVADLEEILGVTPEGQTEGERREEGIGDPRDIPGGKNHRGNPPVPRFEVPGKPHEYPFRRADLAHGVPPDEAGHYDRDPRLSGAHAGHAKVGAVLDAAPSPVPVYIVEKAGGRKAKAYADTRHVTVPAASGEPVMLCPDNPARSLVQLLNEDPTHNCRVGRLQDLQYDAQNSVVTGGARLPAGASGYTVLRTQEALYALSESSSTVAVSLILENDQAGAL